MASLVKHLAVAIVALALVWVLVMALKAVGQAGPVLGGNETVALITPQGRVDVVAKIDTGADFSSIDEALALSLGLEPTGTVAVLTVEGRVVRQTANLKFVLASRTINATVTLADRSGLSTVMLVGRNDLEGFLVDVSRDFLTRPQGAPRSIGPFFTGGLDEVQLEKIIITIPILGTVVVLLRLLVGLRTYGVFAPVVIGLTLVHLGVVPGIITYALLLAVGVGAHVLLLTRLKLPHIAQFCLIMFVLVLALTFFSVLPTGVTISFAGAFFPLIITSHLIEQTSQNIEEHRLGDAIHVLSVTLATAMLLGTYGSVLVRLPFSILWTVLAASLLATIAAGHYLGLRLTELFRFRFLKRTHVHK